MKLRCMPHPGHSICSNSFDGHASKCLSIQCINCSYKLINNKLAIWHKYVLMILQTINKPWQTTPVLYWAYRLKCSCLLPAGY